MLQVHRPSEKPGTRLMAWGHEHVVAFDGHPRLLSLATGEVVHRWDSLAGGAGLRQPSVNMNGPEPPWIARDPVKRRFALAAPEPQAGANHKRPPWRVTILAGE